MAGGAGEDIYWVDSAGDIVTETNVGIDVVNSSVTFMLGANIENLNLIGSGNIDGTGNTLANVLTGNSGINILTGGDGNDTIAGAGGNDRLSGGLGSDTYNFTRGDGQDVVANGDSATTTTDRQLFATGISKTDVWLRQLAGTNNLVVSLLSSDDQITFENWYSSSASKIDEFVLSDGLKLLATDVDALVSAMASYSPASVSSGSGVTPATIPPNVQTAINAAWR
jgi:Ca2+-binding RTX toxin-like protein